MQSTPSPIQLTFARPAACAERVRQGDADLGLIPVAELLSIPDVRIVANTGIACEGPVRSILLITSRPWAKIESLAADENSRTSVNLARILLAERFGVRPQITTAPPDLPSMLESADAALIIGDPALELDPARLPYDSIDLGAAWFQLTGLPMVFAAWAGLPRWQQPEVAHWLDSSYAAGRENIETIVAAESASRAIPPTLVRSYLTGNIRYEIGDRERQGLATFLDRVRSLRRQNG